MVQEAAPPKPRLLYFADPMCSWCWGFSPTIEILRDELGEKVSLHVLLGGLRPGTTEELDGEAKKMIREHWRHVEEASGQSFDFSFFERRAFVYDTEPASRAVVVSRRHDPVRALDLLSHLQRAFYAENRDITKRGVLVELVAELGLHDESFEQEFDSEAARQETLKDFEFSRQMGVRGFPTLIGAAPSGVYSTLTRGYQPSSRILRLVKVWLEQTIPG